jgi:Flp pilus assembly protein TadG
MRNLFRLIGRFYSDRRGNIAVTFVIASLPIMSAIGCAVDYSLATRMKAKLQSAADAASVASISQNTPGYLAAAAMTSNGSVGPAVTDANNIFDGDISGLVGYQNLTRTATVTKTGIRLASTVTFSADVPTIFMRVIGPSYQRLTVTGSSSSAASLPPYLDFYLTLDVSGSMGLPSTSAEAVRMQSVNPDNYRQYPTGCTLACHFAPVTQACTDSGTQGYPTNNVCLGYAISRVSQSGYANLLTTTTVNSTYPKGKKLSSTMVSGLPNSLYQALPPVSSCPTAGTDACIQLRLDAVGFALNATQAANGMSGLFETANNSAKVTNQFRIGLYPFIQYLYSTYFPLTSSISGSSTNSSTINYAAANLASLLDTNLDTNLGSGGTHIDTALNSMNTLITSVGDGSSWNNTLPYVFLVTDGAQDPQTKLLNQSGGWSGSNHATVIDPVNTNVCSQLKTRGIIVSVLYIPYQTINPVNTSFAGDEDDYANWNIPNIPASLSGCASPGFFYTANTPADITAALKAMFDHALVTAHITN